MKRYLFLLFFIAAFNIQLSVAQSDPEFPKGFLMQLKLHNGMITSFKSTPQLYVGGVQLMPQITVVEHLLRAGLLADAIYYNRKMQAALGPAISLKIKTFGAGFFGSAGNIHLTFDHVWGTGHERMVGAGIIAGMGDVLTLGLTADRDYYFNSWLFQSEVGIRISKKKKVIEPFNQ